MESNTITLDDFILEMMKIPSKELEVNKLDTLFQSLDLNTDLIQKNIFFNEDSYARNLVCRTPRFDMLVLCWKPGQVTTIHDHVNSLNVTRVFEGTLTARNYEVVERPSDHKDGPGRVSGKGLPLECRLWGDPPTRKYFRQGPDHHSCLCPSVEGHHRLLPFRKFRTSPSPIHPRG